MPDLEKYIKSHFDEFNSNEPDSGHFTRFENRLNAQPQLKPSGRNRSLLLKIAATILILIILSAFIFEFATREIRERFYAEKAKTELPPEIMQAVQYYDNQTNAQIATLNKLAANREDAGTLNASVLKEIQSLDATTNELKISLLKNPGNDHILDAIIQNQQMKETMLNTIITHMSVQKNIKQ